MQKFVPKTIACLASTVLLGSMCLAQAGQDLYKQKCASCHGADGAGAMAKKMGSRDLNSDEVQKMSDKDLATVISTGKGKMPGYKGKLTDDQINDVVKHIKTLKKT